MTLIPKVESPKVDKEVAISWHKLKINECEHEMLKYESWILHHKKQIKKLSEQNDQKLKGGKE